jgi:hypothetical protein
VGLEVVAGVVVEVGRVEKGLGRDAADVQAGAAKAAAGLNAGGLQERGRAERRVRGVSLGLVACNGRAKGTLRPSCAALMAATYPPGPPPMITTSYLSGPGSKVSTTAV